MPKRVTLTRKWFHVLLGVSVLVIDGESWGWWNTREAREMEQTLNADPFCLSAFLAQKECV